jgi:hypothetical protein
MVVAAAGDVHRTGGLRGRDTSIVVAGDIYAIENWDIALALISLDSCILHEDPLGSSLLQNMHTDIQILPS